MTGSDKVEKRVQISQRSVSATLERVKILLSSLWDIIWKYFRLAWWSIVGRLRLRNHLNSFAGWLVELRHNGADLVGCVLSLVTVTRSKQPVVGAEEAHHSHHTSETDIVLEFQRPVPPRLKLSRLYSKGYAYCKSL